MELACNVNGCKCGLLQKRQSNLVIIDKQVSSMITGVGVPAPVRDHHCQGRGDEDCDGESGVGVATIERAKH